MHSCLSLNSAIIPDIGQETIYHIKRACIRDFKITNAGSFTYGDLVLG